MVDLQIYHLIVHLSYVAATEVTLTLLSLLLGLSVLKSTQLPLITRMLVALMEDLASEEAGFQGANQGRRRKI